MISATCDYMFTVNSVQTNPILQLVNVQLCRYVQNVTVKITVSGPDMRFIVFPHCFRVYPFSSHFY